MTIQSFELSFNYHLQKSLKIYLHLAVDRWNWSFIPIGGWTMPLNFIKALFQIWRKKRTWMFFLLFFSHLLILSKLQFLFSLFCCCCCFSFWIVCNFYLVAVVENLPIFHKIKCGLKKDLYNLQSVYVCVFFCFITFQNFAGSLVYFTLIYVNLTNY